MTSEICIMNKHAAVLAADSAVTVTEWDGERKRTRYFKGANKIYQMSNSAPLGAMIYGGGELQGIPWEIILKDYRKILGIKKFDEAREYVDDFFSYIKTHPAFFSEERKQELSIYNITVAAGEILVEAQKKYSETITIEQIEVFTEELQETLKNSKISQYFSTASIESIEQKYLDVSSNALHGILENQYKSEKLSETTKKICKAAIKVLLVMPTNYLNNTGIVFVGFGEKDYFPVMIEYKCYGVLFDEIVLDPEPDISINVENPAYVKPFAMSEMVDTFLNGIGGTLYSYIMRNINFMLDYHLKEAVDVLNKSYGCTIEESVLGNEAFLEQKTECLKKFSTLFVDNIKKEHRTPLMRVVGSLSINEMSELAETLIMLESLKERMTKDSESIGGAIDVAVINKNEGFVWIKRKHYFDPKLNVKYFQRNLFQVE